MEPRSVATITGLVLVVGGVGSLIAQLLSPVHFWILNETLDGVRLALDTNAVGFGALASGTALIVAATIQRSQQPAPWVTHALSHPSPPVPSRPHKAA